MTASKSPREVVLFFLNPHRGAYLLILVLNLLIAALEAATVFIVVPLFSELLGSGPSLKSLGMPGRLLDAAFGLLPSMNPIARGCLLIIGLTALKFAVSLFAQYKAARASGELLYEVKRRLLEAYARAPYEYFLETRQGRMSYLAASATAKLAHLVLKVPELGAELARFLALAGLLLWLNAPAALGLIAFVAAFDRIVRAISSRLSYTFGKGRVEAAAQQAIVLNEFINGVKQMRIFGVAERWIARFDEASRKFVDLYVQDTSILLAPKPVLEMAAITVIFGGILLLHLAAPQRAVESLPVLAALAMASMKALPSVSAIGRSRLEIMGSLPDAEALYEVLTKPFPPLRGGQRRFSGLASGIRFEGVRFGYPGRGELYGGLDLEFRRHKTTAIVGDSGSGKTTILNLLLGLYEPSAGRILVDGADFRELDPRSWLDRVAVVTQDPFIFHGTVAENIAFGRDRFSAQDIARVAGLAQAHDFISALPEGYATVVGERGMKLSGGQQQRIVIARAVLSDPEVLILDEATSSLDSVSEAAVQGAISEAARGRTTIQVAHRLSTIGSADHIYVLHEGRVAEQGSHEQLLSLGGRYARFHSLQASR
ncbi:MAG: ABC transporter ATP-binding protein [Elusimicrobiota bacterium]